MKEKKEKSTRHGHVCPKCNSPRVRILNTKTRGRLYPQFMQERIYRRNQEGCCQDCGYRWWQKVKLKEKVVAVKMVDKRTHAES